MLKFKRLIFAVLLVCFLSTTCFAFVPAIVAGLTLAEALVGTTILSVVAANSAYYVSRNELPSIGQVFPTIGFIQRYGKILWTDTSNPAQPVTKSAPVTVDIPIQTVKDQVTKNPTAFPKLYNTFYQSFPAPVELPPVMADDKIYVLGKTFVPTSYSYSSIGYYGSVVVNQAEIDRVYNDTGKQCSNTYTGLVYSQTGNYQIPLYVDRCMHATLSTQAGENTGSGKYYRMDYIRYEVVMPVERQLTSAVALDSTYAAEIDNLIIANPSSVQGMDGVNDPVVPADLVGSGVTAIAQPVNVNVNVNAISKADMADLVGTATPPDGGSYDASIIAPDKKSIGSLLGNLFTNSPLAGIVRSFTIQTSNQQSVVVLGTAYGKELSIDFAQWQSTFTACGGVLLILAHGFAVLIVMKGWKNG